jgi:hypothetical protein
MTTPNLEKDAEAAVLAGSAFDADLFGVMV